jgi:hypothetical protein
MHRVRFSIRQMAIAVAVMAVISFAYAEIYLPFHRAYWSGKVTKHADLESLSRKLAASEPRGSKAERSWLLEAVLHANLKRRYEAVRDNPLRPIPRDLVLVPW